MEENLFFLLPMRDGYHHHHHLWVHVTWLWKRFWTAHKLDPNATPPKHLPFLSTLPPITSPLWLSNFFHVWIFLLSSNIFSCGFYFMQRSQWLRLTSPTLSLHSTHVCFSSFYPLCPCPWFLVSPWPKQSDNPLKPHLHTPPKPISLILLFFSCVRGFRISDGAVLRCKHLQY